MFREIREGRHTRYSPGIDSRVSRTITVHVVSRPRFGFAKFQLGHGCAPDTDGRGPLSQARSAAPAALSEDRPRHRCDNI